MAKNHLGERSFQTFEGWKRAIKKEFPGVTFEGNRDIAQALVIVPGMKPGYAVGEWDGSEGCIHANVNPPLADSTPSPSFELVNEETGNPVNVGETVTDFRGETATVTGLQPPRHSGSTGRVYVTLPGFGTAEYFPSVYNLKIVQR